MDDNLKTDSGKEKEKTTDSSKIIKKRSMAEGTAKERNDYNIKKELIERIMTPCFYSFILILILCISTISAVFKLGFESSDAMLKMVIPLVTTYIGYSIGKKDTK